VRRDLLRVAGYSGRVDAEQLREVVQSDEDAWNAHDPERLAALMSSDMEFHTPSAAAVVRGRDGFREIAERYLRALPDFRIVNRPIAFTDHDVVVLWRVTGTHRAPLLVELQATRSRSFMVELPSSGRRVDVAGCSVLTIDADGLIARSEEYWNQAAIVPLLGVRPFVVDVARAALGGLRRIARRSG
jgi:steroid delta-isomerase-like uncharacterized protein